MIEAVLEHGDNGATPPTDQAQEPPTLAEIVGLETPQPDSGGPSNDIVDQLRGFGVPDDLVKQVENGSLMQADYTRKTQQLAADRRALEMQAQSAVGRAQGYAQGVNAGIGSNGGQAPSTPQTKVEHFLETVKAEAPEAIGVFESLLEAVQEDVASRIQQGQAPLQRQVVLQNAEGIFDKMFEQSLVPAFGDPIRELKPQIVSECLQLFQNGHTQITPENVLWAYHGDVARKVQTHNVRTQIEQEKQGQLQGSMEGLAPALHVSPKPLPPPRRQDNIPRGPKTASEIWHEFVRDLNTGGPRR